MNNPNKHKKNISKLHKEKLGMDIPDDFFASSKKTILNAVIQEEKPKQTIFWLTPRFAYPIAASIILAIAFTFWIQNNNSNKSNEITNTKFIKTIDSNLDDDFLIRSLIVSDSEMETYLDNYLINSIVIEAEISEQQLENIFINSVIIEDSLIDSYLDKNLIENIVL